MGVTHSIETFVTVTRAFTLTTSDGVFASETRTTTTETIVVTSFLTRQKEGRTTTILLTTSWETTAVTTHASLVDGVFVITGDPLVEETAGGPTTMIVDYEEDEVPTDEVPTDEVLPMRCLPLRLPVRLTIFLWFVMKKWWME